MSEQYVREIMRKCVATICKKYRISRVSSVGVDVLVDVAFMHMKHIVSEIERISSQRKRMCPRLADVVDASIPPNKKRRREIYIHSVLLNNCIQDRSGVQAIPSIPLVQTALFGDQPRQSFLDKQFPQKAALPSAPEEECLWGSVNPDSPLFAPSQPKSVKPSFSSFSTTKRQSDLISASNSNVKKSL